MIKSILLLAFIGIIIAFVVSWIGSLTTLVTAQRQTAVMRCLESAQGSAELAKACVGK